MSRADHFLRHLFHRRCAWCHEMGYARGYHAAAVEADRRERHIKELLQAGIDPWGFEESLRARIADSERGVA